MKEIQKIRVEVFQTGRLTASWGYFTEEEFSSFLRKEAEEKIYQKAKNPLFRGEMYYVKPENGLPFMISHPEPEKITEEGLEVTTLYPFCRNEKFGWECEHALHHHRLTKRVICQKGDSFDCCPIPELEDEE